MIEIVQRYQARALVYREYYDNPKNREQEACFGASIVNVIDAVIERIHEFDDPTWVDGISNILFHRWYIGVLGTAAYEREFGAEELKKYYDPESALVWGESLRIACVAEHNPDMFDERQEQVEATREFPEEIAAALASLNEGILLSGDWLVPDHQEYVTYLQTVVHDFIDLSDALIEVGGGTKHDWDLLIDIISANSHSGLLAKAAHVLGVTREALENFFTLAIRRAERLALQEGGPALDCPVID